MRFQERRCFLCFLPSLSSPSSIPLLSFSSTFSSAHFPSDPWTQRTGQERSTAQSDDGSDEGEERDNEGGRRRREERRREWSEEVEGCGRRQFCLSPFPSPAGGV
eukprot:762926-Hanusia_phi.AAC.5